MAYELGRFEARHGHSIGTKALGTFLSNRLYLHRLQPMYALNLVAGLDAQGHVPLHSFSNICPPNALLFHFFCCVLSFSDTALYLVRNFHNKLKRHIISFIPCPGRGAIYSYDVIGSYNRVAAACCGRGQVSVKLPLFSCLHTKGW